MGNVVVAAVEESARRALADRPRPASNWACR